VAAGLTITRQEIQQEQDSLPQPSTGTAAPADAVTAGLANTQQQQDNLLQQEQELQQQQDTLLQQQQQDSLLQQQEQELQHELHQKPLEPSHSSSSTAHPPTSSMSAGDNENGKHANARSAAAAAAGPLSMRLLALQSVGSCSHFHVVWPRLCLGSSHCNIQVRIL
jgi:hypothetical protein